jgi:hypothetical protein
MISEITFATKSLFENVTFDRNADSWAFSFTDNIYVNASGFWRLLKNNSIAFVSLDNGHQFGLPKPLDLIEELKKELEGKGLTKVEVIKDTFDLALTFTHGLKLEIYIASTGYESYDFSINGKRYIGLGSGDIAIIDSE